MSGEAGWVNGWRLFRTPILLRESPAFELKALSVSDAATYMPVARGSRCFAIRAMRRGTLFFASSS